MKVLNRIKEFADSRGLTAYALWKSTTLSEPTVYRLYNDPSLVPSGKVLEGFAVAFPDTTPNDWLKFESDSPTGSDRPSTSTPPAPKPPAKASRRSGTRRKAKDPSAVAQFGVGDCVRLPSGDRAYIDSVEGDYAHITWEMSKAEDFTPLHLLTLVHKAA